MERVGDVAEGLVSLLKKIQLTYTMVVSLVGGIVNIVSAQPHILVSIIAQPELKTNNINNKYREIIAPSKVLVLNPSYKIADTPL